MTPADIIKVGITGGIGSGKSTVCRMFGLLGVPVYYSDLRAKELMSEDASLIAGIKKMFGADSYKDNIPDRSFLAEKVFGDRFSLDILNSLVHPAVMRDFHSWAVSPGNHMAGYVILESAIIFDAGLSGELDAVVTISAPEELRIERVVARDNTCRTNVRARMASQMSDDERESLADHIIRNDEKTLVWEQVLELDRIFRNYGRRRK